MNTIKLKSSIFSVFCYLMLIASCSSDSIDNGDLGESGYTRSLWSQDVIPVELKSFSELPKWLREKTEHMDEKDRKLARYKIFQGKHHDETIYYIDNMLSSFLGFYHQDGRVFDTDDYKEFDGVVSFSLFTDWICIYSENPLVKGLKGIFHFVPNEDSYDSYVENGNKRYYVWGYLNDSNLQIYDGKHVVLGGFSTGEFKNKNAVDNICYGIEATYIRLHSE